MTRQRRRVKYDAAARQAGGEFDHALHCHRIGGGVVSLPKTSAEPAADWSTTIAAAVCHVVLDDRGRHQGDAEAADCHVDDGCE